MRVLILFVMLVSMVSCKNENRAIKMQGLNSVGFVPTEDLQHLSEEDLPLVITPSIHMELFSPSDLSKVKLVVETPNGYYVKTCNHYIDNNWVVILGYGNGETYKEAVAETPVPENGMHNVLVWHDYQHRHSVEDDVDDQHLIDHVRKHLEGISANHRSGQTVIDPRRSR